MINKVDGVNGVRGAAPIRKSGKAERTGGTNFAQHLQDESVSGPAGVSGLNPIAGIGAILGVQEVDDATQRASKGKKRATQMLEELDDLRLALLGGVLSKDQLLRLAGTVQSEKAQVDDPHLAQILDDIDLRARVELAKYGF